MSAAEIFTQHVLALNKYAFQLLNKACYVWFIGVGLTTHVRVENICNKASLLSIKFPTPF